MSNSRGTHPRSRGVSARALLEILALLKSCALQIAHELDSPCDSRLRARRRRVHRIPRSTSVTIAIRPSDEAGRAKEDTERDRREVDYFLRQDWTTQISLMRLDKSPFSRTRLF